jgi:amidase
MSTELWRLSAGEMFQQLEGGDVSSRELVDAHLDRVAEVNPKVNAIVEVLADQARDAADAADRQRRSGTEVGPFHGVPITVKTNIDVTGSSTHEGMPGLMGLVATSDAPIVSKMRGAGAIVLGRTNMPDFGLRINTVSSLHGATHNPWRHGVTAGGSSGERRPQSLRV